MGNTYKLSDGTRLKKSTIDYRVKKAKEKKIAEFLAVHGYLFCEDCRNNECVPIDCSHDISVDQCQKQGRSELAYDVESITLRGRPCHIKHDKNQQR